MPKAVSLSLGSGEYPYYQTLVDAGFEVAMCPKGKHPFNEDDLIEILSGVSASVAGSEPYTRRVIEASPDLRVIARTGVGFDAVDLKACNERGVVVATTPGVNHHAVAEHTIALLMGIARHFPVQDMAVRKASWTRKAGPRVMGSTIGIVGLGRIGRAVATRAHGLGMKIVSYDPYASVEFADQWNIELVELDELYARSDYVTLHSPATPETTRMINAESLAKMKDTAVVINTARGALIDEPALIEALKTGVIRGAGLDVFEKEPLSADSPLIGMDNVLLSGHIAGLDIESHNGMFNMAAEVIVELYNGGWPSECVRNIEDGSSWKWAK